METYDMIKDMSSKVDPKQEYSATDIVRLGLLPWAKSPQTLSKILASGVLKTTIIGEDTQKRYVVKGEDLIEYIKNFGPVLLHTARKSKKQKHHGKGRSNKAGGKGEA